MAENKGVKVNTTYNEYLESFLNFKRHYIFKEPYILNIIGIRKKHDYSDVLAEKNLSKREEIIKKNHDNFDDALVIFYYDEKHNTKYFICNEFATHPGYENLIKLYINHKYEPKNKTYIGTAILVEGQYINFWKKGTHGTSGKYPYTSLIQKDETDLNVYRDEKLDGMLNMESKFLWNKEKYPLEGGVDIDIHRANKNSLASRIGPHSAGCQVIRRNEEFNKFMQLVELQIKNGKNINIVTENINFYLPKDDYNKKETTFKKDISIKKDFFSYTLISEEEFNNYIKNLI